MLSISTQDLINLGKIIKPVKFDELLMWTEQNSLHVSAEGSTIKFVAKIKAEVNGEHFSCITTKDMLLTILNKMDYAQHHSITKIQLESSLLSFTWGDSKFYLPYRYGHPSLSGSILSSGTQYTFDFISLQKVVTTALKAIDKKAASKYRFIMLQVDNEYCTAIGTDGASMLSASIPVLQKNEQAFTVLMPLELAVTLSKLPDIEPAITMQVTDSLISFQMGDFVLGARPFTEALRYVDVIQQFLTSFKDYPTVATVSLTDLQLLSSLKGESVDVVASPDNLKIEGEHIIHLTNNKWELQENTIEFLLKVKYLNMVTSLFPKRGKISVYFKDALSGLFFVGYKKPIELVYVFMPMKRM